MRLCLVFVEEIRDESRFGFSHWDDHFHAMVSVNLCDRLPAPYRATYFEQFFANRSVKRSNNLFVGNCDGSGSAPCSKCVKTCLKLGLWAQALSGGGVGSSIPQCRKRLSVMLEKLSPMTERIFLYHTELKQFSIYGGKLGSFRDALIR